MGSAEDILNDFRNNKRKIAYALEAQEEDLKKLDMALGHTIDEIGRAILSHAKYFNKGEYSESEIAVLSGKVIGAIKFLEQIRAVIDKISAENRNVKHFDKYFNNLIKELQSFHDDILPKYNQGLIKSQFKNTQSAINSLDKHLSDAKKEIDRVVKENLKVVHLQKEGILKAA